MAGLWSSVASQTVSQTVQIGTDMLPILSLPLAVMFGLMIKGLFT